MGYRSTAWAASAPVKTSTQRLVLMGVGDVHNDEMGFCFCKYETLAEFALVTRRTVISAMAELEVMGRVKVIRRRNKCNIYVLPWGEIHSRWIALGEVSPEPPPIPDEFLSSSPSEARGENISPHRSETPSPRGETISPRGETDDTPGVKLTQAGGETASPITSKEPVTNQEGNLNSVSSEPAAGGSNVMAGEVVVEAHVTSEKHPNPIRPKIDGETDRSPVVALVPMVASHGRPFAITEKLLAQLAATYPGVDALQHARWIREYNLSNETKWKTPKGIRKHINFCFARAQNEAGRRGGGGGTGVRKTQGEQAVEAIDALGGI